MMLTKSFNKNLVVGGWVGWWVVGKSNPTLQAAFNARKRKKRTFALVRFVICSIHQSSHKKEKRMKMVSICCLILILLCEIIVASSSVCRKRASAYINALDVTSSIVATDPQNFANANHHTNALLAKLILADEQGRKEDIDDALKIAKHIIQNNMVDTSFGGLFGAPLLTGGLGKYLPEDTLDSIAQLLYNALPDDPMQPWCDISYSNIYLMHTANLITLGEALGKYGPNADKAASAGYFFWQRWLEYTSVAGFHEFDSPTYTAVQLNGLYILSSYAKKEEHRLDATQVIDFLWTGIAATWFPEGQMLSGAHSRDYDFLFGKGLLTSQLFIAQISDAANEGLYTCEYKDVHCEAMVCPWDVEMAESAVLNCIGSGLQAVYAYLAMVNVKVNQYTMPKHVVKLSSESTKLVEKRWQEGTAGDYHLFVSSYFALGLVSDDYNTNLHKDFLPYPPNAQDKILSLALASRNVVSQNNPLSVLSLEADWRRDGVYGKENWAPQGKPFHLRMRPTAAMSSKVSSSGISAGTAAVSVLMLALDPLLNETSQAPPPNGTANHLALNTLLPWMDTFAMRINEQTISNIPVIMSTAGNFSIDAGSLPLITLLGNNATAVVRIFLADSCGQEVKKSYSRVRGDAGNDGGLEFHTLRLETVMFDSSDNSQDVRTSCASSGLLRLGMIVAAADATKGVENMLELEQMVRNAQPDIVVDGTVTSVDVTLGGVQFELARDFEGSSESSDGAIKYRRVNGVDVQAAGGAKGANIYVNGNDVAQFPTH